MNKNILIAVIVAVVVIAIGGYFLIGRQKAGEPVGGGSAPQAQNTAGVNQSPAMQATPTLAAPVPAKEVVKDQFQNTNPFDQKAANPFDGYKNPFGQ